MEAAASGGDEMEHAMMLSLAEAGQPILTPRGTLEPTVARAGFAGAGLSGGIADLAAQYAAMSAGFGGGGPAAVVRPADFGDEGNDLAAALALSMGAPPPAAVAPRAAGGLGGLPEFGWGAAEAVSPRTQAWRAERREASSREAASRNWERTEQDRCANRAPR